MIICVFGASSPSIDDKYKTAVERLGEIMAQRGHELVFGAGGNGLMGAAAIGVSRGGGKIHGVIPEFFKEEGVEAIFPACDKLTYTETMRERKAVMEDDADAFIVVPGGIGTYEELFEILTLKQLGRHKKTIVLLNTDGFYDKLLEFMDFGVKNKFMTENVLSLMAYASEPERAVILAENAGDCDFSVKDLKEG